MGQRCSAPRRLEKGRGSQLPPGTEQPQHLLLMTHCGLVSPPAEKTSLAGERMVPSSPATLGSLLMELSRPHAQSSHVRSQIGISLMKSNELPPGTTLAGVLVLLGWPAHLWHTKSHHEGHWITERDHNGYTNTLVQVFLDTVN